MLGGNTLLAYADDIVILGEFKAELTTSTLNLLKNSKKMGFRVNEIKTKCIIVTRKPTVMQSLRLSLNGPIIYEVENLLEEFEEEGHITKRDFDSKCDHFYEICYNYIYNWSESNNHNSGLKDLLWVTLTSKIIVTWSNAKNSIRFLTTICNTICVEENNFFEQFKMFEKYFKEQNEEWHNISLKEYVKFSFSLPGSNAAVERVFSLMNSTWTKSRNKLDVSTVEATLMIKISFDNMSCCQFYESILANKTLLQKVHSSAKYQTTQDFSADGEHIGHRLKVLYFIIQYLFEEVEDFKYLGVNINQRNDMHNEVKLRLVSANRGYHTMRSMLSTRLLSRKTKTKLYIAYLRPIAMKSEKGHKLGTGFAVHDSIIHTVKNFKDINPRISAITIKTNGSDTVIINVHAPTEEKGDDEKEEFYNTLEDVYNGSSGSIKIIVDLNAKIGRELEYRATTGGHSLHERTNSNGNMLVDFAMGKGMIIKNTNNGDPDEKWKDLRETIKEVTDTTLGKKKNTIKQWFNRICEEAIIRRKTARQKWLEDVNNENNFRRFKTRQKVAYNIIRCEKRKYMKDIIVSAENNYRGHRTRELYQQVNKLGSKYKRNERFLKDNNGSLITTNEALIERWKRYLDDLLNCNEPEKMLTFSLTNENNNGCPEPTLEEIKIQLKTLKNNKFPGEDGIQAELLKKGGKEMAKMIWDLIGSIRRKESLPEDWKTVIICPIYKNGDAQDYNNYRGISLLNVTYKILSNCILSSIKGRAEEIIGNYQGGFRIRKSTIDQIFILRQVFQKAWNIIRNYMSFSLISKKPTIVYTEKAVMETKVKIKVGDLISDPLLVKSGLRQGDALSPILFNLVLERVVKEINVNNQGFKLQNSSIKLLAYMDDVVLLREYQERPKNIFLKLEKAAAKVGLQSNEGKTAYMCVDRRKLHQPTNTLNIGRFNFNKVQQFKYLGTIVREKNL
ncbi:hypothetical protein QTP88_026743 [Uroleucon formosanum]